MGQRRSARLFAPRRRRRPLGCLTVLFLLAATIALALSLNGLSNRYARLESRKVTVLNLPRELEGFAVLHLSDLNAASLGDKQENLMAALGRESYQAVALTGDMVGKSGDAGPLLDLLDSLPDTVPVFLIEGDADPSPLLSSPHGDGEVYAGYIQKAQAHGAIYLEIPYRMEIDGKVVWFCPGELFLIDLENAMFALSAQIKALEAAENPYAPDTGAQLRHAKHRQNALAAAQEAMAQMQTTDTIIALMHHPPDDEQLSELSARVREGGSPSPSLFLAGQFNNGQMRLPGLGPLYIPRQMNGAGGFLPGDDGFTGLVMIKGFPVHISPGLGASAYYPVPLRLFNRPAATLISLTSRMTR